MLTVGQNLWFVPADKRWQKPDFVRVVKIGRKWAYLDKRGYRINVQSLYVDGGDYTSPGRCYVSRDAYEIEAAAGAYWQKLRNSMHHRYVRPENVSLADMQAAAKLLQLID